MKKLMFLLLIVFYSCSSSSKKQEPVQAKSPLEYFEESGRWSKISDEYLEKQMYYVGRKDMTPEDHAKFNEYSALVKMALDSARFYMDKYKMFKRTEELKEKYNNLEK
jgi:hypothetical protein